jgi:hypothetical protein
MTAFSKLPETWWPSSDIQAAGRTLPKNLSRNTSRWIGGDTAKTILITHLAQPAYVWYKP